MKNKETKQEIDPQILWVFHRESDRGYGCSIHSSKSERRTASRINWQASEKMKSAYDQ